jgi:hypothetical protein
MTIKRIQFTEWLPDQPAIGQGMQDARNVVPVAAGYAPISSATILSGAASENINNVFAGKVGDTVQVFAGGDTKLFKLNPTTNALDDVSKLYSTASSSAYNGNSRWKFVQFGSAVIGTDYASPLQVWNIGSSSNFESLGRYVSGTYIRGATGNMAITTTVAHGLTIGSTYTFDFTSGAAASNSFVISNAVITNVARTSNVVTITTSVSHGYAVGHTVTVTAGTNTSVNGTFTIASVPTSTTFTYAQTATDISSVSDTGSVYNTKAFMISNGTGSTSGNVKVYTSIAPSAKYIAVVRDFVVVGNVSDTEANKITWSDINDETNWQSGAASQSDFQIIADGGTIQGVTGGEFGIILLEKAIYRMQYIGSPYFFQFDAISRNIGCAEGQSVINSNGITYFLSDDGFYECDGRNVIPIGAEKIDKYFYSNFNFNQSSTMSVSADPTKKIVVWNYPTVDGGRELLIYHWQLKKWTRADATFNDANNVTRDISYLSQNSIASSSGTTLEGLDSAYIVNVTSLTSTQNGKTYTITSLGTTTTAQWQAIGVVGTPVVGTKFTKSGSTGVGTGTAVDLTASLAANKTMDTMSTSLDDRIYSSGKFVFAGSSLNYIITFTGVNATANLIMSDIEEGYNSVVTLVRPIIDNGSANISIASRRELDDNIQFTTPVSSGEANRVPLRSAGRFHRLSVTPNGNWTTAASIDVTLEPQGGR